MEPLGRIGVLSRFGSQMVRVCGRILEDGTTSRIFTDKLLVMVLKFRFRHDLWNGETTIMRGNYYE